MKRLNDSTDPLVIDGHHHERQIQVSAESGGIFVATSTSNTVAVLRTLPELVVSASEVKQRYSVSDRLDSLAAHHPLV
jgi:hypothetical protein